MDAVNNYQESDLFDELEKLVLRYAEDLTRRFETDSGNSSIFSAKSADIISPNHATPTTSRSIAAASARIQNPARRKLPPR